MNEEFHGCRGKRWMKTQTKRNIVRSNTRLRIKLLAPAQNESCEVGGMLEGHFSGQGQHVVKVALMLECHFSWQEQYFVTWDNCLVAGARHAAFFHATCVSQAQKVNSANKRFADWQIHGGTMVGSRITLGSWSDLLAGTFSVLSWRVILGVKQNIWVSLFVAGALFGEIAMMLELYFVSGQCWVKLHSLLSWHAQYLAKTRVARAKLCDVDVLLECCFSWLAQYVVKLQWSCLGVSLFLAEAMFVEVVKRSWEQESELRKFANLWNRSLGKSINPNEQVKQITPEKKNKRKKSLIKNDELSQETTKSGQGTSRSRL